MGSEPTKNTSTSTNGTAADNGEVRLMQAYLLALRQYNGTHSGRGIDVVNGNLNAETRRACNQFMQSNGGTCSLNTQQQVDVVIATLRRAHDASNTTQGVDDSLATRTRLSRAFEGSRAQQLYPDLAHIHPQMRFPLAAALHDLARQGIIVSIGEGYRPPERQEALVMIGYSAAVPSRSFHSYGLAADLSVRTENPADRFKASAPEWQTTLAVMQRYGFYSLHANQGWDLPHFELPARTNELRSWPNGSDGFKDIPDNKIPASWRALNERALERLQSTSRQTFMR